MKNAGIIKQRAIQSVMATIDKLQELVVMNGGTIYARINQQDELKKNGIAIPPLEFLLFGNPSIGGSMMLENPIVALDLPLKVIAWEDGQQQVWVAYNDNSYLQERHGLKPDNNSPLALDKLIGKALDNNPE